MLTINIVCVGKIKEKFFSDAIAEYSKRLSKYCKFEIIEVADEKLPAKINDSIISEIKYKESQKIIQKIKKDSYVIALDLSGKELSSVELSKEIENIALNYNSQITFIIGGTLGLTDQILKLSNDKLCFSKMTFPHQLIRIFLVEQLFRAFKISNNEILSLVKIYVGSQKEFLYKKSIYWGTILWPQTQIKINF